MRVEGGKEVDECRDETGDNVGEYSREEGSCAQSRGMVSLKADGRTGRK